jgi:hypothetical protein
MNPDVSTALAICGAIVGVGVVISSLETLRSWRDYAKGGIFDGRILASHSLPAESTFARHALGWLFTSSALFALVTVRLIGGATLLVPGIPVGVRALSAAGAFLTGGLLMWRNRYGSDGADQMTAIVLAGVAIGSVFPSSELAQTAAIAFIAAQACLAYLAAGVSKAMSPMWRSGAALGAIMQSETWGSRHLVSMMGNRQWAMLASWSVIVAECAFVSVIVAPSWLTVAILAWGVTFHVSCALAMGFNTFFWAFVASYPPPSCTSRRC